MFLQPYYLHSRFNCLEFRIPCIYFSFCLFSQRSRETICQRHLLCCLDLASHLSQFLIDWNNLDRQAKKFGTCLSPLSDPYFTLDHVTDFRPIWSGDQKGFV